MQHKQCFYTRRYRITERPWRIGISDYDYKGGKEWVCECEHVCLDWDFSCWQWRWYIDFADSSTTWEKDPNVIDLSPHYATYAEFADELKRLKALAQDYWQACQASGNYPDNEANSGSCQTWRHIQGMLNNMAQGVTSHATWQTAQSLYKREFDSRCKAACGKKK